MERRAWRWIAVGLKLKFLPERYAVCRLWPDAELPGWAVGGSFYSVTRTPDELSIVCEEPLVPDAVTAERGWRCLMVEGPLDFSLTGILLSIAEPLAKARVAIFAVSTFNTDYVLVKESSVADAAKALAESGHQIT